MEMILRASVKSPRTDRNPKEGSKDNVLEKELVHHEKSRRQVVYVSDIAQSSSSEVHENWRE